MSWVAQPLIESPARRRLLRNTEILLLVYFAYTAVLSQFLDIPSHIAVETVIINLTVDLLYAYLDPRISYS